MTREHQADRDLAAGGSRSPERGPEAGSERAPESGRTPETGAGPLAVYPITVDVPVAWGDLDAFGHVNNTVFFRWFETARIAFLEAIGFTAGGDAAGVGPILASTSCRFRRPLTFPDTITVGVRVTGLEADRFEHAYRVVSHGLDDVAAEGVGVVVSYDYGTKRKAPIPDVVGRAIRDLVR